MSSPSGVWILIPVHNRLKTTRACLRNLAAQGEFSRSVICVIDDGCTDGTREMLESEFPEVRIAEGSGNLFWGGGMMEGMKFARLHNPEIYFWLNDDCIPEEGAIQCLTEHVRRTRGICGGICHDPENPDVVTYSGDLFASGQVIPAPGETSPVDMINGNLVAVHRDAAERLGLIPGDLYPHYGGDSIYSIRARRAGIPCEVHGSARAVNAANPYLSRYGLDRPAHHVFREPFRVASILYWPTYWRFLRETFGWQAWFRWPFYFKRLAVHYLAALRRQIF